MKAKILLAEDDESIGYIVKDCLEVQDYEVVLCTDGSAAVRQFSKEAFQLCLLDVMLPQKDGFSVAKEIRAISPLVPILFLTAKGQKEDKLEGFRAGGDDYIVKPFSMEELLCRIEVFLRRSGTVNERKKWTIGQFVFDYQNMLLTRNSKEVRLTQKEGEILYVFCCAPDTVIKRETILLHVWGNDDYFMGRSLDVFIVKLRKYLAEDPAIELQNIHGIGFRLMVKS